MHPKYLIEKTKIISQQWIISLSYTQMDFQSRVKGKEGDPIYRDANTATDWNI
jgi:hypothetical protein